MIFDSWLKSMVVRKFPRVKGNVFCDYNDKKASMHALAENVI
jgi:hypothetical protein